MFGLFMSKMLSFLAEGTTEGVTNIDIGKVGYNETWWARTLAPIAELVGEILVPLLIVIGAAGGLYAIVLGVQYSKAESSEKRDEAKKRLINMIIGVLVLIVLLVLLVLFCKNVHDIGRWVTDMVNKTDMNV